MQAHDHAVADPGHGHNQRCARNADNSNITSTIWANATDHFDGSTIIGSFTNISIYDSAHTETRPVNATENRPYNYGVNWIIKL